MQHQEILDKLKEIISPYVPNKEMLESVTEETDLMKDLKINSQHLPPTYISTH